MAAPDPVDFRLLSLVAEAGRAAVHEIAAKLGIDPREAASRLVALSATGLPLIVGVECDQNRLRNAIGQLNQAMAQGTASGPYQVPQPGSQSGGYAVRPGPVTGTPSGPYATGTPSGSYPPPYRQPVPPGPPSGPFPAAPTAISTWGPPQTAAWARGDGPTQPAVPTSARGTVSQLGPTAPSSGPAGPAPSLSARSGRVGDTLNTEGLDGEQVAIQLIEVVDPADFLFTAAGYRLREGERAVVVHTEMTNRGAVPFPTLPDLYLMLISADGDAISKAPVSLSSRPPHRIGVKPGETAGGHTVYVLPDTTQITAVRWSPRPDENGRPDDRSVTWAVES